MRSLLSEMTMLRALDNGPHPDNGAQAEALVAALEAAS
jgi:hypothetical protein